MAERQDIYAAIQRKYSKFEYVGGYTNCSGHLYLLCVDCGTVFKYNAQITRPAYKAQVCCPTCKATMLRIARDAKAKKKQEDKKNQRERNYEKRFKKKFNARYGHAFEYVSGYDSKDKYSRITVKCKECNGYKVLALSSMFGNEANIECKHCGANRKGVCVGVCAECGTEYKQWTRQQTLCRKCHDAKEARKKAQSRSLHKRIRETRAATNGEVDWSITLDRLIERDGCMCYLCNKQTDKDDYTMCDGTFIAGANYPSIDHVIPLAKGGKHQWNNVRVAHRKCNWEKGCG